METGIEYGVPGTPRELPGRLDKSGDVSGLASRGTYEKIPEIGILSPEIPEIQ